MITSHIKKSLFILVIYLLTIQSALSLVGGKPFTDLPHGSEISQIAQNVVGITINSSDLFTSECTGIMISNDKVLSSEHCFYQQDILGLKMRTWSTDMEKVWTIGLGVSDKIKYPPQYIGDKNLSGLKGANSWIAFAQSIFTDIACINHTTGVTEHSYVLPIIKNINELNDKMFNNNTRFYIFAWGSNKKFEYTTLKNHVDVNTNNPYNISSADKQRQFLWRYMNFQYTSADEATAYTKFYHEYPTALEFNIFYTLEDPFLGIWLKNNHDGVVTVPSILLFSKHFDAENNILEVQNGDSGGPVVACNNEGNDCNLIGLIEGETDSENLITTLAMPFAQKLLR